MGAGRDRFTEQPVVTGRRSVRAAGAAADGWDLRDATRLWVNTATSLCHAVALRVCRTHQPSLRVACVPVRGRLPVWRGVRERKIYVTGCRYSAQRRRWYRRTVGCVPLAREFLPRRRSKSDLTMRCFVKCKVPKPSFPGVAGIMVKHLVRRGRRGGPPTDPTPSATAGGRTRKVQSAGSRGTHGLTPGGGRAEQAAKP